MAEKQISAVFEELFEQMRVFATQISAFPEPSELAVSQGTSEGVAAAFHRELKGLSSDLTKVAEIIRKELEQTELAVRATARDMADTDAEIADGARKIVEQLEGIPAAPTPAPAPATTSTAPVPGNSRK